jgi:uncharacterized protein YicC (UPF0701 family)
MSRLARALAIDPATLSNWFHRGDTSARINTAVYATAQQLTRIDQELAQKLKAINEEIDELKKRSGARDRRAIWGLLDLCTH